MPTHYNKDQFPPTNLDWEALAIPLASASDAIGRYDSFLRIIPNPEILISPIMMSEAVSSSKIEGTHTTVSEVLVYEAGKTDFNQSQQNDILEVLNYRKALSEAFEMMKKLPLSGRVIRSAHHTLLQGVRGQFKSPGLYRTEQNWIGRSNKIEEARYVPIAPEDLEDAMSRWERYVNEDTHQSLIKIAVAHVEFESIHPFCDGNGRIGRIIIPLMLCSEGLMSIPCFYLSEFFEHRNTEYQDRLLGVSASGAWTEWCKFFLEALATQGKENYEKAKNIFALYEKTRSDLLQQSNSPNAEKIVSKLFESPIFPSTTFTQAQEVGEKTVRRLLGILKEMGIIIEVEPHSGQRPAIMAFPKLLEITEGITLT